mgnify:CR=1
MSEEVKYLFIIIIMLISIIRDGPFEKTLIYSAFMQSFAGVIQSG